MNRWSIRVRLTLWYSLVLLAGLALFGTGIWVVVSRSLIASLDETLKEQARGAATVLQSESDYSEPQHDMSEELSEYARATPGGNLMEIRDSQGRALLSPKKLPIDSTSPSGRYRTFRTTELVRGKPYEICVATPLDATESTLRRVKILFLWTVPVVLLLASLGGYWISRRALAPVDAITSAARSIGIGNLSQRLAVPATGDELQRLSATWNDMLARLESAVKRLSQFTADASHELRTPIALIRTTAELTLRRERSAETYREALRQV
ncbi:MAG TPA: histidine kinase dimerization/phospho-acceptor domain-containing protein, partial [Bryobacteraceae bacterium]|nr:histidine kinase dimerization/phospho-acceptor domain-containing protein [Bryobacteraceae bacterium]